MFRQSRTAAASALVLVFALAFASFAPASASAATSASISGTLTFSDGSPAAGLSIYRQATRIESQEYGSPVYTTTDMNGNYEFTGLDDTWDYLVVWQNAGYTTGRPFDGDSSYYTGEIELDPGENVVGIDGTVFAAASATIGISQDPSGFSSFSFSEWYITAYRWYDDLHVWRFYTNSVTNPNGQVTFRDLRPGKYYFEGEYGAVSPHVGGHIAIPSRGTYDVAEGSSNTSLTIVVGQPGTSNGIWSLYGSTGYVNGVLGSDVGPTVSIPASGTGSPGVMQRFQSGNIYSSRYYGTFIVSGVILAKYRALGEVAGFGWPAGPETCDATTCSQQFSKGGELFLDPLAVTAPPTIVGVPLVGAPLTVNPGRYSPDATSYYYSWFLDGNRIIGASAATYTPVAADIGSTIQVEVTALRAGRSHAVTRTSSTGAVKPPPVEPGAFVSLAPSRLLDTRSGVGAPVGAVASGGVVTLQVTGRGGVPTTGASAVVLNVTIAGSTGSGFVTAYATGSALPTASNVNFVAGQVVPNLVVVPVGADGRVNLYNGSPGATQLVADVAGYYLSGVPVSPGAFGALAPSRLLDTRSGAGAPVGAVAPGGVVALQVTGRGGVPSSGVSAVVLNVTVAGSSGSGYVTAYAGGSVRPTASNLNFVPGQVVPNLVVVPVGADGRVNLYNGSPGATQLVADVAGYYVAGAPVEPGAFVSLAPSRLVDTRSGVGASVGAVAPGGVVALQVAGRAGIPASGVSAVVLNVTVAGSAGSGFVTAYAGGSGLPTASNVNFVAGQVVPNLVVVPVGADGRVNLYNGSPGATQLVADVAGYYLDAR